VLGNKEKQLLNDIAGLSERLQLDKLYEFAASEIEEGQFALAAKARAVEDAAGDSSKVASFYITHRVRMLRDEMMAQTLKKEQDILKRQEQVAAHRRQEEEREEREEEEREEEERLRAKKWEKFEKIFGVILGAVLAFLMLIAFFFLIGNGYSLKVSIAWVFILWAAFIFMIHRIR
jgi:cation transport ATPase